MKCSSSKCGKTGISTHFGIVFRKLHKRMETTGLCTKYNTTVNEKFIKKKLQNWGIFSIYSSLLLKRKLFDPVKLQQKLTE